MLAGLVPEDELCLLLARGQLLPDVRARALELLAAPLRWDPLLQRAGEQQVLPLLYRSLRTLEFQGVPNEVRARLTAAFRVNAVRNVFLACELTRVLRLLGEAGIRVLPLKGVTLAKSLYGDPAFRVSSDIDILVPVSEAPRARRLILAQGYTSPFTEDFFLNHQFHTSADCTLLPQRGALSYVLELHWTLLQHSSKDAEAMQDLWSQARPRDFFGIQAYSLTLEWEFLYLAGHAAHHKWQTLKWVADIHDLCVSASIDWQKVREKAERFNLDLVVGSTLTACSSLYGTPAPANFSSGALLAGVQLFPNSLAPSEAWKAPLFYPKLLKRSSEKLRWFADVFFVARLADRRFFHLPRSLDFLYYLLRPLRLTFKWSRLFLSAGFRRLRRWLRFSLE
jgi:hypothetical protein